MRSVLHRQEEEISILQNLCRNLLKHDHANGKVLTDIDYFGGHADLRNRDWF